MPGQGIRPTPRVVSAACGAHAIAAGGARRRLTALLAGMLVLSTHVPLGKRVLERGIIFIDLAIAQVAGVGVILADTMGWEAHGWEVQLVAVTAAMTAALAAPYFYFLWRTDRRVAREATTEGVFR